MSQQDQCICPKECDCQNPPSDDPEGPEGGAYGISNLCLEHNIYPMPDPECPVHGHMGRIEFSIACD